MKAFSIIIALFSIAFSASAQGLSAPDDPSQLGTIPTTPTDTTSTANTAPIIQPKHNDPAESWRAERNFIREGNSQFADSNFHRALEMYDKALAENAGSLAARYNKATTLLRLATLDNAGTANDPRIAARSIYHQLLPDARRYNPEIAHLAYYNLGNMSYNDGDYASAIDLYEASLRLEPNDWNARYNLRLAQLKQQNQDQDQQEQEQEQEQQQQEQQEQQQQQQEQQQQEQQQNMTQPAEQILHSMQNKENETRRKVQEQEQQANPSRRAQPEKPW